MKLRREERVMEAVRNVQTCSASQSMKFTSGKCQHASSGSCCEVDRWSVAGCQRGAVTASAAGIFYHGRQLLFRPTYSKQGGGGAAINKTCLSLPVEVGRSRGNSTYNLLCWTKRELVGSFPSEQPRVQPQQRRVPGGGQDQANMLHLAEAPVHTHRDECGPLCALLRIARKGSSWGDSGRATFSIITDTLLFSVCFTVALLASDSQKQRVLRDTSVPGDRFLTSPRVLVSSCPSASTGTCLRSAHEHERWCLCGWALSCRDQTSLLWNIRNLLTETIQDRQFGEDAAPPPPPPPPHPPPPHPPPPPPPPSSPAQPAGGRHTVNLGALVLQAWFSSPGSPALVLQAEHR
ncbi:unnamed protein product [Pleuronectes platessa]|uniref:Uncharacterized protein n=1 Tax=Pleuronectes platessa TaxID=8262 RepID=A0A9N7VXZ1_PLEPL|nr:unnamed protein product [Pleuronectes platessa]